MVIAKPITLPEAEAILDTLDRFAQMDAARYGAEAAERADAATAVADLRAWLADLASRRRITTSVQDGPQ